MTDEKLLALAKNFILAVTDQLGDTLAGTKSTPSYDRRLGKLPKEDPELKAMFAKDTPSTPPAGAKETPRVDPYLLILGILVRRRDAHKLSGYTVETARDISDVVQKLYEVKP